MTEIELVVTENQEFQYRDRSVIENFFDFFDCRDYDGRIRVESYSIESSSASGIVSIETLGEEIKFDVVKK